MPDATPSTPPTPGPSSFIPAPASPSPGIITVSKLNIALLTLAILSIGGALYLSPLPKAVESGVKGVSEAAGIVGSGLPAPSATSASGSSGRAGASGASPRGSSATTTATGSRSWGKGGGSTNRVLAGTGASSLSGRVNAIYRPGVTSRSTPTVPTTSRTSSWTTAPRTPVTTKTVTASTSPTTPAAVTPLRTKCWQFTWQQDAQAVYVSNLSDPYGLDGAPGPYDSDGIACSDLPVDPARAASMPVGQYVPRAASAATKAAIVGSQSSFYGFTEDGLPADTSKFDALEASAGKAPSSVGWYQTFDDSYRGDLVGQSWSRGALPVFTWMPTATGANHVSLSSVISGAQDAYLRKFAGDIVRTNLPVVIRYGHEMNGSWYGWSSGRTDYNNSAEKYKQAWIHVWSVFQEVGANDDAIWLWSPSRVDDLHPSSTNGITAMADSYPGDAYVDWVGASVYLRHASTGSTYDATFGRTVAALEAVSTKPLFFAEIGAIETDGGTDVPQLKADFIHNTLSAFASDARIVGFLWNNNISTQLVNGVEVTNDWRFNANAAAAKQFVTDVAARRFRTGMVALDQ
ncbi:MAG: hypothetical protein M3Y71_13475 [Actinomycetota bacterium]|nr:hypothetical protein [Actinomycetota bacterium]